MDSALFSSEGRFQHLCLFLRQLGPLYPSSYDDLFSSISSVAECEAIALQLALQIAMICSFEQVIFESDYQALVKVVFNGRFYKNDRNFIV
jgi:hypothetical protein